MGIDYESVSMLFLLDFGLVSKLAVDHETIDDLLNHFKLNYKFS